MRIFFFCWLKLSNDDTDEQVQGEERPKDDEDDKIDVHVEVALPLGLLLVLEESRQVRQAATGMGWRACQRKVSTRGVRVRVRGGRGWS